MGELTPRKKREQRAYTLTLVGGGAALATVVLLVLAVVGAVGLGLPFLTALVAAGAAYGFRRTVGS